MELSKHAIGRAAAVFGLALAIGGAPFVLGTAGADEAGDEGVGLPAGITRVADFTDRSTGVFPDINANATYQNTGNRGCMACHDDLYDVNKDNGTYTHITTYVGMKDGTYDADCKTCHSLASALCGNVMSENIHVSHYSSDAFVSMNGNCWSCHAMTVDGDGNAKMLLVEDLMYDAAWGGYPDAIENDATVAFSLARGFDTGYFSGVSVESAPDLTVDLDQEFNAEEDQFLIMNFERIDGDDAYATIDAQTWTLEVTGVMNPRSFTLEELKELPQTETVAAQWCAVNGINGAMVQNTPISGVLLSDLIEACGGLAGGCNAAYFTAIDGWEHMDGSDVQTLIDSNVMICLGMYGHDLTLEQGAPAKLFVPGANGSNSVKYLSNIDFAHTDTPMLLGVDSDCGFFAVNATWFVNDGVEAKVGEVVQLEGAAYGFSNVKQDAHPAAVEFSFDYGRTWTTVEVPEGFDPQQWTHFTLNWTPSEAGTYVVKARTVGANGAEQAEDSNLIVLVSE